MKYLKGSYIVVPNREYLAGTGPGPQALFMWMCSFANQDGECFPSRSTLAECVGVSERSIDEYLKTLIDMEIVQKDNRFSGNEKISNLYTIHILGGRAESALPRAESALPLEQNLRIELNPIELNPIKASFASESNEDSSEDEIQQVEVDEDGYEIQYFKKKPVKERKDKIALRMIALFNGKAKKYTGITRSNGGGDYFAALNAIKAGLSENNIENLFEDWFAQKSDEEAISLTAALSANNINRFKVRENIV